MDVKVRAPFSRPELRSQTPRTSVDVTICSVVFFPPQPDCHAAALKHYMKQLALAHTNCTNTKHIVYSLDALESCTGQESVSLGNVMFPPDHLHFMSLQHAGKNA